MALATNSSNARLKFINQDECWIKIPIFGGGGARGDCKGGLSGVYCIVPRILPDISDTKKANYADVNVIGRSSPIKTFSHSANRVIGIKLHFLASIDSQGRDQNITSNLDDLRAIQSATYPRPGEPYQPPPVCAIKMGKLLGESPVCAVLDTYNVSYLSTVAWHPDLIVPYYFQVQTTWHVVYATTGSNSLPNQERILGQGR